MGKVFTKLALLTVCMVALVVAMNLSSETKREPTFKVETKVILPTPVREGDDEEGVYIG